MFRIMGVYRGAEKVGCEVFAGELARKFPSFKDAALFHLNLMRVKRTCKGLLLFLNLNVQTLIVEFQEIKRIIEIEGRDVNVILELDIESFLREGSDLTWIRRKIPRLSFDHVRFAQEHFELIKKMSPDYIKIPIKELEALSPKSIPVVGEMIQDFTGSTLVVTHVETPAEFSLVSDKFLWMGFYEKELRQDLFTKREESGSKL